MQKLKLVLKNSVSFDGYSFGANNSVSGELVFNTGMVGYPEAFTDPSYRGQILVMTYPLIGNYGVPGNEKKHNLETGFESDKIQIAALVVSEYSKDFSHWDAKLSISDWLKKNDVPAICGVDTRALAKKLREKGVMLGKIISGKDISFNDPNKRNLVSEVSIKKPVIYKRGKTKIVLVDCGVKNNIIRSLLKRDATVIRVPWNYDFFNFKADGIVLSNGPGNPKMCRKTILNVKRALKNNIPVFGICLGNQILALAAGADTYKLKYGHRSQNQPCLLKGTKRCYITTQNHGYAVNEKTLPEDWESYFVNLNDNTNEGIRHKSKPFMSVQFHPEATPSSVDTGFLFDDFLRLIKNKK